MRNTQKRDSDFAYFAYFAVKKFLVCGDPICSQARLAPLESVDELNDDNPAVAMLLSVATLGYRPKNQQHFRAERGELASISGKTPMANGGIKQFNSISGFTYAASFNVPSNGLGILFSETRNSATETVALPGNESAD